MKYLHSDPDIMGGDLVIKGTRIPIETILYRVADGYTIEDLHHMYPTPTITTLKGAVREALDLLSPNLHGEKIL